MEHSTVDQLTEQALELPSDDRASLADRLVESLDPTDDATLQRLWGAEALRRLDDVRAGRVESVPAEEAFKQIRHAVGR
jgi:putative addiction module component (TIGR02574 family)